MTNKNMSKKIGTCIQSWCLNDIRSTTAMRANQQVIYPLMRYCQMYLNQIPTVKQLHFELPNRDSKNIIEVQLLDDT